MKADNPTALLKRFAPDLEKTSKLGVAWIIFCVLLVLLGIFALITQITRGHIVTGMRDNVVWGIYIVNFIFFMGISYAGALISGTLHLFRSDWRKPIIRMAEFLTIFSLLIGPLYIMLCVGRLDKLHYLVIFGRIQSPITWDVIAISTDIIGCFLFLYLALLRDFARLRDYPDLKVAKWRKKLYRWLAIYWKDTPEQRRRLERSTDIMAGMVIAIAIIVYSVLAWIFSVTLQPGWHSTIFGPYFVIAAVYSGTAVLIVIMWIYRKIYKLEDLITRKHFVNIGVVMLVLGAFFGYFTFSEYLTKWYGSEKNDEQLISILFDRYYWLFLFSNYAGVLVPLIVVGLPKLRTIRWITLAAVVVIVALWINRYLIVVPTLETPYLPVQDARDAWVHYRGTWVEWVLTIGGIGSLCLFFTIGSKMVPIIPLSVVEDDKKID
ncbi:MAG: polysulfide reductase NrfD [Bacteroidetes bacterium]|nr:polysulfide reductase NrfD [Bacteroidota bacterium]MBL6962911.1 polysulfide reductase NrfD [Bacteroidota bacterium]